MEGTEEYIEMDVSSAAVSGGGSPPHASEFEFRMASAAAADIPVTSPADELFYKGKLLPLHLPPRLQMVQLLLEETAAAVPSSSHGPPELGPDNSTQALPRNSWARTLKLIRQSNISLKFRASKDYLKCIFTKPARKTAEDCSGHRRSFTGVLNHRPSLNSPSPSTTTCTTSSVSLKRSSSANSEVECSVQGAIAYCKKSSELALAGRKSFGDVGCCALSHSKVAAACET